MFQTLMFWFWLLTNDPDENIVLRICSGLVEVHIKLNSFRCTVYDVQSSTLESFDVEKTNSA